MKRALIAICMLSLIGGAATWAVAGDVNDRRAAIRVIQQAMDHYAECFLGGPAKQSSQPSSDR